MFDEMKEALSKGRFVALVKKIDGGVMVAGSYTSAECAYADFAADSQEEAAAIPEVVFVSLFPLPPLPRTL